MPNPQPITESIAMLKDTIYSQAGLGHTCLISPSVGVTRAAQVAYNALPRWTEQAALHWPVPAWAGTVIFALPMLVWT